MDRKRKRPGRSGTTEARRQQHLEAPRIIPHPTIARKRDHALLTVCRRTLHELATARRAHRETMTPELSDALDMAMDALSVAGEVRP